MNTAATTAPSDQWLKRMVIGRNPRWTLVRVAIFVVTVIILFKFIFIPIQVVGISMAPNYIEGKIRLVNKLSYRNARPQRGDVVAVRMKSEHVVLLKRIIALPGERVQFVREKGRGRGKVRILINGQPLEEPYIKLPIHRSWGETWPRDWVLVIPKGQYYLIGDNRSMPFVDHYRYLAERDEILGKVLH
ncbi:MAG: signal peptidase I [Verrucomicrobia bacterium]|nr:signal peptidase I [Verrucomicrobiota bacterium]